MKLLITWLAAFGLAIVVAASCSIEHRSDAFACEKTSDCTDGRTCSGGFCVLTNVPVDGPSDMPDAPTDAREMGDCPPSCTSCNRDEMQCTIDCQSADCTAQVVCPTGWNCNILCNEQNSCRNGVNCLTAGSCDIECSGEAACRNVACGTGKCNVACTGNSSCRSISCGQSCACDVSCGEGSSCETVICSSFQCETLDGCTSQSLGCSLCE